MLKIKKEKSKIVQIIREIILYGIIGSTCATIDSVLFIVLFKVGMNVYFANFIGINIGIFCSFMLNTYCNFKKTDKIVRRGLKFLSIGYCGLVLSMVILYIGTQQYNCYEINVKLFSIIIVAIFQFLLNKFVTYR